MKEKIYERAYFKKNGVPNGSRTRAVALKGRCPRPLDDGDLMLCKLLDFQTFVNKNIDIKQH